VSGLVYITAFAPDKGESVASLIANPPPGAPVPPILPPKDGYLFLDPTKFAASFAADVEPELASFMSGVNMRMPRRPREMVTYHCCAFVAGLMVESENRT
jgi:hypothetical protein